MSKRVKFYGDPNGDPFLRIDPYSALTRFSDTKHDPSGITKSFTEM